MNKRILPKSILEFMDAFNTDDRCLEYIASIRYNNGWHCPVCRGRKYYLIYTRNLMRCRKCRYEESVISNTTLRYTKKSLREWFWTIYRLATEKSGFSAMELYRQLGFGSYQTAWTWLQKIRMGMANPERSKLKGNIEVDETYIQTGTGERGRELGSQASLVVCAVEMRYHKRGFAASGRIRLRQLPDASAASLHQFILDNIEIGSTVKTDGWTGYKGIEKYGYNHFVDVIGDPKEASKKFPRVHRIFSNLKANIIGTHRFISVKHMQNYLNEFMFRFNRRKSINRSFNDLLEIALFMPARTYEGFVESEKVYYVNPK